MTTTHTEFLQEGHKGQEAHAAEPTNVQDVVIPSATTTHAEVVDPPQREMISSSELPPGGNTRNSVPIETQWVAKRLLELLEVYGTSPLYL